MSWLNGIELRSANELQSEQNKKNAENSAINRKILDDLQKFIDNHHGLASETYPIPNRTNLETELLEENNILKKDIEALKGKIKFLENQIKKLQKINKSKSIKNQKDNRLSNKRNTRKQNYNTI